LLPDPAEDAVQALFLLVKDERALSENPRYQAWVISWGEETDRNHVVGAEFLQAHNETDLFSLFLEKVREIDPDMIVGFETQKNSLGYLIERYRHLLTLNLCQDLSRIQTPGGKEGFLNEDHEGWEFRHSSGIHITGRVVLNVWRILKSDITLTTYTYENFVYHILHQRVPHYTFEMLTEFYTNPALRQRWRVFAHYLDRARKSIDMLDKLEVVDQASEFARVFGTDFYSVLTRGSQYKVESVMLRVSRAHNFVALSPGPQQVRVLGWVCVCV